MGDREVRGPRRWTAAAFACLVLLAVPQAASADIYCVDWSGPPPPQGSQACTPPSFTGSTGVQQALDAAAAHPGLDHVALGPNTYTPTAPQGFTYTGDDVTIQGNYGPSGRTKIAVDAPTMIPGMFTTYGGFKLTPQFGSSVSLAYMDVTLPAPFGDGSNQSYVGVDAGGAYDATISDMEFTAPPPQINTTGIFMGAGTISRVVVDLPLTPFTSGYRGNANTNASSSIKNSEIAAGTAVSYGNPGTGSLAISNSTITGSDYGVSADGSDSRVSVTNSLIELPANNGTGVGAGFLNDYDSTQTEVDLDGVTIGAAPGTAGTVGIRAIARDSGSNPTPVAPDTATVDVVNTVIDPGIQTSISRNAGEGGTANVTTDYSYWTTSFENDNGGTGLGDITAGPDDVSSAGGVVPMFANPATGDFHLLASSPLIDKGDPAAVPFGIKDLDGDPRALQAGTCATGRRDIGADEYLGPGNPPNCIVTPGLPPLDNGNPGTTIGDTGTPPKKCKKGQKLKKGKCVKKKRKRRK